MRREVLEALFARPDRTRRLLDAVEKKTVLAGAPGSRSRSAIAQPVRRRPVQAGTALLAGQVAPDRKRVINDYRSALDLKGDALKGKLVFKNVCSTCHRLEDVGTKVGPDLRRPRQQDRRLAGGHSRPEREVDPRYVNYIVSTKAGRILTGIIVGEGTSASPCGMHRRKRMLFC